NHGRWLLVEASRAQKPSRDVADAWHRLLRGVAMGGSVKLERSMALVQGGGNRRECPVGISPSAPHAHISTRGGPVPSSKLLLLPGARKPLVDLIEVAHLSTASMTSGTVVCLLGGSASRREKCKRLANTSPMCPLSSASQKQSCRGEPSAPAAWSHLTLGSRPGFGGDGRCGARIDRVRRRSSTEKNPCGTSPV